MRLVTMLLAALMALSACNTVQGVGRDVQGAGEVIESGAAKVKRAVTN
ncbi:MAG TPA: entericidin A/B family lipoprotein [Paracoccaceae bacterium]|nr:entericidin A/B family lipoprotein [Paracoccaceae bacterium]